MAFTFLALVAGTAWGAEAEAAPAPKFLGVQSCSSSGCHGGAKDNFNQVLIWQRRDFHTRSFATLTTRRSERLAEVLKLGDPSQSVRCTSCHAPFHEVPAEHRDSSIKIEQGVSCENCHGPAEPWIRTHTRTDLSHEEKVAAGMRDLRDLYVRSNTCVACHQNVDPELIAAGHPELLFELDGQCATEPRHWRERREGLGSAAWLTGQAVALREMSWQLSKPKTSAGVNSQSAVARARSGETERWAALLWLLQKFDLPEVARGEFGSVSKETNEQSAAQVQRGADTVARAASEAPWSHEKAEAVLKRLAATQAEFSVRQIPRSLQARRAERLVLGLDRLLMALPDAEATRMKSVMEELFGAVQSVQDFDPSKFAASLQSFSAHLTALGK